MHSTKRITSHGSINIPVQLRRDMGLSPKDALDVGLDERGRIVLTPHNPKYVFCGSEKDQVVFRGRHICKECCWEALKLFEKQKGGETDE